MASETAKNLSWLPKVSVANQGWLDKLLLGRPFGNAQFVGDKGAKFAKEVHGVTMGSGPGYFGEKQCNGILTYFAPRAARLLAS